MSLHLVFSESGWRACCPLREPQDAVVFIGDGVYATGAASIHNAFVIAEDLAIRGIRGNQDISGIDYPELVTLCTRHKPIVSWNS
jgi:sulfur relay protein TusB/DsrH